MRKHWLRCAALLAALGMFGCKARPTEQQDNPQPTPPEATVGLGDRTDISLQDWLKQSRPELARRVREQADLVRAQQKAARDDTTVQAFLPQLHAPLLIPVLHDATWSETQQVSLPTWLEAGQHDADLALHLARHGDVDAALKVAPDKPALRKQLEELRKGPNIPLEWSQLVGLQLFQAQLRLTAGEPDGATELVLLHRQLLEVLPPEARQGPLGAALLPLGRRSLVEAARAWRESRPALAADIDKAVAEWGALPSPALPRLTGEAGQARLFDVPCLQQAVVFPKGQPARRAFDLLSLPVNPEGLDSVLVLVDAQNANRIAEVFFVYGGRVSGIYPDLNALAHPVLDRGLDKPATSSGGLSALPFAGGTVVGDAWLLPRNRGFGALLRFRDPEAKAGTSLTRDFGAVHLDRSFEANRLQVDPALPTDRPTISSKEAEVLPRVVVRTPHRPEQVQLQRDTEPRLLARLTLTWSAAEKDEAIARLLLPLISAWGPPRLEQIEQESVGAALALVWKDEKTTLTLRLPYGQEHPDLVGANSGGGDVKDRVAAASAFDLEERNARLDSSHPFVRLPRWLATDTITLGQDKDKALEVLTRLPAERYTRFPVTNGVGFLMLDPTPNDATWFPRQLVVRFGPGDKVAEIRMRTEERGKPSPGNPSLADRLRRQAGAGEKRVAPWQGLWGDLAPQGAAALFHWADDQTEMTYQRDFGGGEVILRDCPRDLPDGVVLPPLEFIERGVPGAQLGDTRAQVLAAFKESTQKPLAEGVLLLTGKGVPYPQVVVYFEGDRVVRVLARFATRRPDTPPAPKDTRLVLTPGSDNSLALAGFVDSNRQHLGVMRRVDPLSDRGEQGWAWHDDRTRLRLFTNTQPDGLALMAEWRNWPVPATWSAPPVPFKPVDRPPDPREPKRTRPPG